MSEDLHHRIIQKQLQMKHEILDLIEKYLKKDIQNICRYVCVRYVYLQRRDRKLLMIKD